MSLKDRISGLFVEDEETTNLENEDEEVEPKQSFFRKQSEPVEKANSDVVIAEPGVFEDAFTIGERLKTNSMVIVNLQRLSPTYKQRMIDILQGVTYGIGGKTVKIDVNTILCTPKRFTLEGSVSSGQNYED